MRIAQIVANLDIGGLERLAVDLAGAQKAAGHLPTIYCLGKKGVFAAQAESTGIPVIAFEKGAGMSPRTVWQIAQQLRRDRPDVLHGHNHLVHHYAVAASRLAGVPVVANTRHGAEVRILEKPDGSGFYRNDESPDKKADMIFRAALPWTDALIFISEDTRRFFVEHRGIPIEKTHVILNGAPLEPFLARMAAPGSVPSRFRFGTAGRLVPVKNHLLLIDAFAIVARTLANAELHIAGDGPMLRRVEQKIEEHGIQQRVFLHGALADMPGFMSGLDAFVLSSLSEGLPITILEAMAAGLPIASTRVAGVPEAAPEGQVALYSENGDTDGLAQAMIALANRADLVEMGQRGRRSAQTRFTIEHTWKEHHMLFQSLLDGASLKAA